MLERLNFKQWPCLLYLFLCPLLISCNNVSSTEVYNLGDIESVLRRDYENRFEVLFLEDNSIKIRVKSVESSAPIDVDNILIDEDLLLFVEENPHGFRLIIKNGLSSNFITYKQFGMPAVEEVMSGQKFTYYSSIKFVPDLFQANTSN